MTFKARQAPVLRNLLLAKVKQKHLSGATDLYMLNSAFIKPKILILMKIL